MPVIQEGADDILVPGLYSSTWDSQAQAEASSSTKKVTVADPRFTASVSTAARADPAANVVSSEERSLIMNKLNQNTGSINLQAAALVSSPG